MGSIRRDCLDHVVVLNERHLRKLLKKYFVYYHESRTHLGLAKEAPELRASDGPGGDHCHSAGRRPAPPL